jgi:AcrR family transcriptional regulator
MLSRSSSPERNIPRQDRSSRRVESLLDAAEEIFAEVGYETATMTEIGERAGTSIGGLYRYFPDKFAVAQALIHRYAEHMESYWVPLIEDARDLSAHELANQFVGRIEEFVMKHPAYLVLTSASVQFARDATSLRGKGLQFAKVFEARNPTLTKARTLFIANVVIQLLKGMMNLYAESRPKDRSEVRAEFKRLLSSYLEDVLGAS